MYQPPLFREERIDVLHQLIRNHPLGMLISVGPDGEPEANTIPMLLDTAGEGKGRLQCHLARANPQWKMLGENPRALVVFQGPDSYITPSWYETKRETGKVVPTWNYAMVQVRGTVTVRDDREWLARQIRAVTDAHESRRREAWSVDDAPSDFITSQIKGIVGIEIEIRAIEGKWKVSQNRSEADKAGVIAGLIERATGEDEAMAGLVQSSSRS